MDEMDLDELNELEDDVDEEEERIFEQYRYSCYYRYRYRYIYYLFPDRVRILVTCCRPTNLYAI